MGSARGSSFGRPIPLYIMTSPENHQATVDFFQANGRFGLEHVRFFLQGQMPAVDKATGRVLLATKDHVALSPDGHGGTLVALATHGRSGPDRLLLGSVAESFIRDSKAPLLIVHVPAPARHVTSHDAATAPTH